MVAPVNINPDVAPTLTLGAWVKTASLEVGQRKILGHDDGGWDRAIGLDGRTIEAGGTLPDGTLRYAAFTGQNNQGPTQGDPAPTPTDPNAWTFIAGVYDQDAKKVTLYVDLDVASTSDAPQAITDAADMGSGPAEVSIGGLSPNGNSEAWLGSIDNGFFLTGTIDAATIANIRNGGTAALLPFTADPILVVSGTSPFSNLPAGAGVTTIPLGITNSGATQTLKLEGIRIVGKDAANYSVGASPVSLAPGKAGAIGGGHSRELRERQQQLRNRYRGIRKRCCGELRDAEKRIRHHSSQRVDGGLVAHRRTA